MTNSIFQVQVVNCLPAARILPYKVAVVLPGDTPDQEDRRFDGKGDLRVLRIRNPTTDDHHIALGKFLDAWSGLEVAVFSAVAKLFGTDIQRATILSGLVGTRGLVDLLGALSQLAPQIPLGQVTRLADRLKELNTKRNKIVHGHWLLEAVIYLNDNEAQLKTRLFRFYTPNNPAVTESLKDLKNQKARSAHLFSLNKLSVITKEVLKLREDFGLIA